MSGRPDGSVGRGLDGGSADQYGAGAGDDHRGDHHRRPADQLQNDHAQTLDHQHLALSEIHRVTGHDTCSTRLRVRELSDRCRAQLSGADGLAVTDFSHHEYNHYPLSVQAIPGDELTLRVEYDTEVFDAADIETADRATATRPWRP